MSGLSGFMSRRIGIKVVGLFVLRRFRWDEIDHFAVLPLGGYPYVGHVVLRDGRKVGTYGIGSPGRPKSKAGAVSPSGAAACSITSIRFWRSDSGTCQPADPSPGCRRGRCRSLSSHRSLRRSDEDRRRPDFAPCRRGLEAGGRMRLKASASHGASHLVETPRCS